MPCYNASATVVRAIESIIHQKYLQWELVIIDDGSSDNTYDLISQYVDFPNINILQNSQNKGCYYSRNIGLYHAKDKAWDYFTIHDADDESSFDRLEIYSHYIKSKPQLDYIYSAGEGDRWVSHNCLSFISKSMWVGQAFISRRIFNTIGYFNHDTKFGADAEYEFRVDNMFASLYNEESLLEHTWKEKLLLKYKVYGKLTNKFNYTYKFYSTFSNLTLKHSYEKRKKFADSWPNKYKDLKNIKIEFTPHKENL